MRPTSGRICVVLLAAGSVALAAGCGGGSKNSSSSTPAQTPASTASSTTKTTSGGSGSGPDFASAKNCRDLAALATKAASAITASGNPATALRTEAAELQALANAAPSEIRGDFQAFAAAFTGYLHTLEKVGYTPGSKTSPTPSAAQAAAIAKAVKSFDTAKLRKAEQHLSAWGKQNCKGLDVGG